MTIRPEEIAEAERLRLASKADQRAHVAWLKSIAANPDLSDHDRMEASTRARALERLLNLKPRKGKE